jgi:hypothetical protein
MPVPLFDSAAKVTEVLPLLYLHGLSSKDGVGGDPADRRLAAGVPGLRRA